jgi:hemin uptake protein HemP
MLMRTLPLTDNSARSSVVALRPAPTTTRRIESKNLLDGSRELVIEHQGNEYHLRLTRNDKLILTK